MSDHDCPVCGFTPDSGEKLVLILDRTPHATFAGQTQVDVGPYDGVYMRASDPRLIAWREEQEREARELGEID